MKTKLFLLIYLVFSFFFVESYSQSIQNPNSIITLATGLSNPNYIATDSIYVYWVEYGSGSIKKVLNTGGTVTTLVSGLYSPKSLTFDNTDIYFAEDVGSNSAKIKKIPKNGGTVTTIVDNLYSIEALVMDNTDIFFCDYPGNKIMKISKSGGVVTTLSTQTNSPSGLVIDENNVYWTEFTNPGTVKKVLKTGGSTTTLGNNSNTVGIAVDNSYLYWTENVYSNQGKINKVPINGGSTIQLATGLNYAWDLCIDNYNVYWVENRSTGEVKQVSKNGGTVISITNNVNEPVSITSDNNYIYWVERVGGAAGAGFLKKADKYLSPPAPNLLAPLNNSTNQLPTVLLDWDSLAATNSYKIQLATDSLFNSITYDTSGVTHSYVQMRPGILLAGAKYFWRVNATNLAGTGSWSVVWNFRINPTGIYQYSSGIPKEFKLYNNFPNPFNPSTIIRFSLPKEGSAKLVIFDALGREVEILVNATLKPGTYETSFDGSSLNSGVYFYKISAGDFSETKKMLMIK